MIYQRFLLHHIGYLDYCHVWIGRVCSLVEGSGQGFVQVGNRIPSAQKQSPIEILMMKITTKSQIETCLPEQKQNGSINVHCASVRPNIAKPHVSGWQVCLYAFSSALMSNFFIPMYTSITFCAFVGSLKSFGSTVGTICHETPNLSLSQPQLLSCPPSAVKLFQ